VDIRDENARERGTEVLEGVGLEGGGAPGLARLIAELLRLLHVPAPHEVEQRGHPPPPHLRNPPPRWESATPSVAGDQAWGRQGTGVGTSGGGPDHGERQRCRGQRKRRPQRHPAPSGTYPHPGGDPRKPPGDEPGTHKTVKGLAFWVGGGGGKSTSGQWQVAGRGFLSTQEGEGGGRGEHAVLLGDVLLLKRRPPVPAVQVQRALPHGGPPGMGYGSTPILSDHTIWVEGKGAWRRGAVGPLLSPEVGFVVTGAPSSL